MPNNLINLPWNYSEIIELTEQERTMTDNRENAIRFLGDVVKKNGGIKTSAELERERAVNFLTGKTQEEPLRGPSNALAQSIRRNLG
jgi:hypothetical protein